MAGYLGSRPVVVQVDGYQRTEAESRYVNVSGDDFTGHLDFTDDAKARFGSSDEMHIYTESSGSGYSYIQGDSIVLRKANQSTNYLTAIGGVVSLMHSGATKLATTSTGIDITGTVTAKVAQTANTVMPVARITTSGTYNSSGSANAGGALSFGQYDDTYPAWNLGQIAGIRLGDGWSGDLLFYTNSGSSQTNITEKARLDSSGNLLVAKTTIATGTAGVALRSNGEVRGTVSGGAAARFSRLSSDGDIVGFEKDGASIGSINAVASEITIGSNDAFLWTSGNNNAFLPASTATGGASNGLLDLGSTGRRFKDLHLSGTANAYRMKVSTASSGASADASADELVVESNGNAGISILSGQSNSGSIYFGDAGVNWDGYIAYSQANRAMTLGTAAGAGSVTINSTGNVGIGTNSLDIGGNGSSYVGLSIIKTSGGDRSAFIELGDNQNADTGHIGNINFVGHYQNAGHKVMGQIGAAASGSTSGQRGSYLHFKTKGNGSSTLSERMRIDNEGRVGIANDTPGDFNASGDDLVIGNSSGNRGITIRSGTSNSGNLFFADGLSGTELYRGFIQYQHADDRLVLGAGGDDRVWISSSGNVGIGTSSPDCMLHLSGGNEEAKIKFQVGTANADKFKIYASTAGRLYVNSDNGSTGVYLTHNGTSWTSNSDETLKDNITSLGTVGDKLKNYRTSYFNWKADTDTPPKRHIGFIAQDWETDFPEVVTKKEGETLGMQYTETIPILLKYIQELEARITALEA